MPATIKLVRNFFPKALNRAAISCALVVASSMVVPACAGRTAQLKKQQVAQEAKIAKLRALARHERVRRQDLEKRLAIKKAEEVRHRGRGLSARESPPRAMVARDRPNLPVQALSRQAVPDALRRGHKVSVRKPQTLSSEYDLPDNYEVMGIDSEGVEIVYVGEATSDKVVVVSNTSDTKYRAAPSSSRVGSRDRADGYDYDDEPLRHSLGTARSVVAKRAMAPAPSARLPITRGVPTIDSQLLQAREATLPARTRSFGDPRSEYKRYYEALRAGNHAYAVTGFRNFVQRYPHHEFADNAQYWLGEAFYDQKRYKSALVEFRKVAIDHPEGNKVPDALLKLGYCYRQLGQQANARAAWQKILRLYPKSDPASLARMKLADNQDQSL